VIRVSVSDLDQYAWYRDHEDFPLSELLKRLRREEEPSEAMLAGTAFHTVLENIGECELNMIDQDGFTFEFVLDAEIALPDIRELKIEQQINGVNLVGKVDAIEGFKVHDHKLTGRFDPERYANAMQWKAYLYLFGASVFQYNVFEHRQDRKTGVYRVVDFHKLTLYRYDGLDDDVRSAVNEYRDFALEHLEKAA